MTLKNCSEGDSAGFKLALLFGLLLTGCSYDDQPEARVAGKQVDGTPVSGRVSWVGAQLRPRERWGNDSAGGMK